jgi:hypothetical protein
VAHAGIVAGRMNAPTIYSLSTTSVGYRIELFGYVLIKLADIRMDLAVPL